MIVLFIIFITTCIATFLSAMSGGGASIITLPVFLSLGMAFPLAIAVQKISSTFWVLPAAHNYLYGKKIEWGFLVIFSSIGLLGAYLGVLFVITTDKRVLEIMVGSTILILVAYTYVRKDMGLGVLREVSWSRRVCMYMSALLLGFYESMFGAGNGILFAIISFFTKGYDFISALGYYFAASFLWCAFASFLLVTRGYYDVPIMIAAAAGSVVGAYTGSKLGKYKGNTFIRGVFILVGGTLGIKLIFGL